MSLYLYSPLNNEKTARESPRFFKLRHKKTTFADLFTSKSTHLHAIATPCSAPFYELLRNMAQWSLLHETNSSTLIDKLVDFVRQTRRLC